MLETFFFYICGIITFEVADLYNVCGSLLVRAGITLTGVTWSLDELERGLHPCFIACPLPTFVGRHMCWDVVMNAHEIQIKRAPIIKITD